MNYRVLCLLPPFCKDLEIKHLENKNTSNSNKKVIMSKNIFSIFILICFLISNSAIAQKKEINPAAEGFNAKASDAKAIVIADEVMQAMGGRKAWNKTRYLKWNFFSFRKLTWDRYTGDVRIEDLKSDTKILMNVNTGIGKVMRKGEILSDTSADCKKALERGKKILINDAYWLIMPLKLKDSGVTLKYIGEDKNKDGKPSDILQLTFENVGVTPENKYWVYVDKTTRLVNQWSFFRKASDEKPEFSNIWSDYQRYGKMLLSGNRGREEGNLSEIEAPKKVEKKVFREF
jgi:hypothetical protein